MNIKKIGIAGAGTMGSSLAETFAKYNFTVFLYDLYPAALERAKAYIALNQETEVNEGIVSKEESAALQERIHYSTDMQGFHDADFVIEAVLEKLDIKHSFWSQVSRIVRPDALLATNTSGLSITKIAEAVEYPERFGGMHWINPPHIIPLVEVISGEKTKEETAKAIYDLASFVGKKPVLVKDAPGFALNRIQFAILRECLHIAKEGIASVEDIDNVMKYALGIRYACFGPFEVADFGGLDIFHNISSYLFKELATEDDSFHLLKENFEQGRLGVKSKAGFYDYADGKDVEKIKYRDEIYTKLSKLLFGEK